jgi:hypothetical protein
MNNILVTCVYSKKYGRADEVKSDKDDGLNEIRYQRFHYSLISISNTHIPIIIFTNVDYVGFLQNFCDENLKHKDFKIIGLNLEDLPFYNQIDELKSYNTELNPIGNRYSQIMSAKPYLMKYAIDNNIFQGDKYFWIDAGLSYVSLIPDRHKSGGPTDWFAYSCFDKNFVQRLDQYSQDKMFIILFNPGMGNPYLIQEGIYQFNENPYNNYYMIGGLWGGNKSDVLKFQQLYDEYLNKVINYWKINKKSSHTRMFVDESIFSVIAYNHPENFSPQRFDTWYHEDDITQIHNIKPGDRSFYKIITGES